MYNLSFRVIDFAWWLFIMPKTSATYLYLGKEERVQDKTDTHPQQRRCGWDESESYVANLRLLKNTKV